MSNNIASIIISIILTAWLIIWGVKAIFDLAEIKAFNSYTSKWRWLRKFYWNKARMKLRLEARYDFKVDSFLMKWINQSIVLRKVYIEYGYDTLRLVVSEKRDEYKKKVEELKYNTFDDLSYSENKFIDDYLAQEKKERRKK